MRILTILVLATFASAGPRRVDAVLRHLTLRHGVTIAEGARGLTDAFPYYDALTPRTLPRFIEPIRSTGQAMEAVRLFVAGPLVRTKEQADRVIAAARKLRPEIRHLEMKIHAFRPESYTPSARESEGGFEVSLVAFEMNHYLQLVHVRATVTAAGAVTLKRTPIVDGPMTSWQTGVIAGGYTDVQRAVDRQEKMLAEAKLARERYARALRPKRDLDTAWAISRLAPTILQVQDLWGKPDEDMGSGLVIRSYTLSDGTAVLFGAPGWDRPCVYVRHIKELPSAVALHTLYTQG